MSSQATTQTKGTSKAKTRVYTLICQEWYESERGWGRRPDGYTLYKTEEDRNKHVAAAEKREREQYAKTNYVPDCYTQTDGKPFRVEVPRAIHDQVVRSKDHFIWGKGNTCIYKKVI